ncbi:MAG: hypothetical protein EA369_09375 [Bradymonadales bacterium]|nr:MAG: hypothetical protein EA369_09375 [Bradymonadales bacterium]
MKGISHSYISLFFQGVLALVVFLAWDVSELQAQSFLRDLVTRSPGDLSKHHQEYDGVRGCVSCHVNQLGGDLEFSKCLDCHFEIRQRIEENRGYHRGKDQCSDCHSEHQGRDAYIFAPNPNWVEGYLYGPPDQQREMPAFDHSRDAQWPLIGKHQQVECADCHNTYRRHYQTGEATETRSYLGAPTACYDCHADVYRHEFSRSEWLICTDCHSSGIESWKRMASPMPFNHNTTRYPLVGLHRSVGCVDCHQVQPGESSVTRFAPLPFQQCTDCHYDVHEGKFGSDCESCHSVFKKWTVVEPVAPELKDFDHNKTRFPLKGYHQAVSCESCHYSEEKKYKFPDTGFQECSHCHGLPHGNQFANQSCQDCHVEERRFTESSFDLARHQKTDFPLVGKHQFIQCNQCHHQGQFQELAFGECSDCHVNVHPERQIDRTCHDCHNTTSFAWIDFDHDRQTNFRLTGKHQDVACLSCHVEQIFKNMPASNDEPNCQSCHADPHGAAMSNQCADCHRTEGFHLVRNFQHSDFGFQLDGRHAEISCQNCHPQHLLQDYSIPGSSGAWSAKACVHCHIDVHQGAYGTQCESCHNTSRFEVVGGEKVHDLGFFKLEGAHDQLDCQACHRPDTNLQGLGSLCAWCHEADDIHLGAFGLECQDCHTQTAWHPSTFRHNTTGFRLTGAHRFASCESCHVNQVYQGLPSDCYFCHVDSFVSTFTQDPDPHGGGRNVVVTDCEQCHVPIDWRIRRGGGYNVWGWGVGGSGLRRLSISGLGGGLR